MFIWIWYNKCNWCNTYKRDALKIKLRCKYQNKNICEKCYNIHYLDKCNIKFNDRIDLFF